MLVKKIQKKNGYTRLVDSGDAISSRTKSASPKLTTGYTIIETMISISIFLIVVMIGIGALLNANLIHNKSRDTKTVLDSLNFIMEDMSRNLRTGFDYECLDSYQGGINMSTTPRDCNGGKEIIFKPSGWTATNRTILDYGFVLNGSNNYYDIHSINNNNPESIKLNPDDVKFDSSSGFWVSGAKSPEESDFQQPFVVIRLIGTITTKGNITPFSIQTSVSQRLLQIPGI